MFLNLHICLLDHKCREWADPLHLYPSRWAALASLARVHWLWRGRFHTLALHPEAKIQEYDKTTGKWTHRWVYHTSHPFDRP